MQNNHRTIGPFALTMIGLGSIIGSGWLFGAWKAAKIAGPAALLAWLIGMAAIMIIGFTYAELGAMFPESGGMVRFAQYSHGSFLGFLSSWSSWMAFASVVAIEAEASVQYMSSWPWAWAKWTKDLVVNGQLSGLGLFFTAVLVTVYFLFNYWSVEVFAKSNTIITVFKFVIPALTIIGLLTSGYHSENFTHYGGFMPNGFSSVLTAVATSGIIFAFLGFQSTINLAGEAKNPNRTVPISIFGSILLAGVIYLFLQYAFIGTVPAKMLTNGWAGIDLKSPFADLALFLGLNWLAIVLFADAFVSPSGTGMAYTATTARIVNGMEANHTFPKVFGHLHPKYGAPRPALWLNLVVALIFAFMFRGWGSLADIISTATVITFIIAPISVMSLRRTATEFNRPLKIKGLNIIAPFAFVLSTLILYWSSWPINGEVFLIMLVGLPIYFYYQGKNKNLWAELKGGLWFVVYLVFYAIIAYFGSSKFGGHNAIPYGIDMIVVSLSSLVFYAWGTRSGWVNEYLKEAKKVNDTTRESDHADLKKASTL
jgi:amino acid transporter